MAARRGEARTLHAIYAVAIALPIFLLISSLFRVSVFIFFFIYFIFFSSRIIKVINERDERAFSFHRA